MMQEQRKKVYTKENKDYCSIILKENVKKEQVSRIFLFRKKIHEKFSFRNSRSVPPLVEYKYTSFTFLNSIYHIVEYTKHVRRKTKLKTSIIILWRTDMKIFSFLHIQFPKKNKYNRFINMYTYMKSVDSGCFNILWSSVVQ